MRAVSPLKLARSGWWLPGEDMYFMRFADGPPPKKNGFMRDHLHEALRYVKNWNIAIDVGAHVGFWTWDMAQKFNVVYAFEPTKANYDCLLKNTEEYNNVITYNLAVGDRHTTCAMQNDKQRPGNTGSNYVVPDQGSIEMVLLDQYDFGGCDFLKVDVEGFELRVLQGAKELIDKYKPVISMECTDSKFKGRYDIPDGAAQKWLLKQGYKEVFHMRPDKVFVAQ